MFIDFLTADLKHESFLYTGQEEKGWVIDFTIVTQKDIFILCIIFPLLADNHNQSFNYMNVIYNPVFKYAKAE